MGYFVKEGETVKTSLYIDTSKKRPRVVFEPTSKDLENPHIKKEWFEWYYWNYELQNRITKEATTTNMVTGLPDVDIKILQTGKIRYLLKDWSVTDDEGKKVELKRSGDTLTDESFKIVLSLDPRILLSVLEKLNRILYLSEEEEKN